MLVLGLVAAVRHPPARRGVRGRRRAADRRATTRRPTTATAAPTATGTATDGTGATGTDGGGHRRRRHRRRHRPAAATTGGDDRAAPPAAPAGRTRRPTSASPPPDRDRQHRRRERRARRRLRPGRPRPAGVGRRPSTPRAASTAARSCSRPATTARTAARRSSAPAASSSRTRSFAIVATNTRAMGGAAQYLNDTGHPGDRHADHQQLLPLPALLSPCTPTGYPRDGKTVGYKGKLMYHTGIYRWFKENLKRQQGGGVRLRHRRVEAGRRRLRPGPARSRASTSTRSRCRSRRRASTRPSPRCSSRASSIIVDAMDDGANRKLCDAMARRQFKVTAKVSTIVSMGDNVGDRYNDTCRNSVYIPGNSVPYTTPSQPRASPRSGPPTRSTSPASRSTSGRSRRGRRATCCADGLRRWARPPDPEGLRGLPQRPRRLHGRRRHGRLRLPADRLQHARPAGVLHDRPLAGRQGRLGVRPPTSSRSATPTPSSTAPPRSSRATSADVARFSTVAEGTCAPSPVAG